MSEPRPTTPDDARDLLAAEYVMGLTEPADLPQVEVMIMRDKAFASAVAAWRGRLSPLDATAIPARTGERIWAGIQTAIGPAAARDVPAPAVDRPIAAPAQPQRPIVAPAEGPGFLARWWNSLAFWRMAGLSGAFAALLLAAGLGYFYREASRQPVLIAVLMTEGNEAAAVVNAYADGRAELLPLRDIPVPEGRAIEIWTLWDRSVGPRSIGLIQRAAKTRLRLEGLPAPAPGQLFEMTLEPATGSPTGRPTGPVLNKGNATTAL